MRKQPKDVIICIIINALLIVHILWGLAIPSLHRAAYSGNVRVLDRALRTNADLNRSVYGYTPLHVAAQHGKMECVRVLIRGGADVNSLKDSWETPLHSAIRGYRFDTCKLLLSAGAEPNIGPTPALIWAIGGGQIEYAHLILIHGSDAAVRDQSGVPALFYALLLKDKELIGAMLKHGASFTQTTDNGSSIDEWLKENGNKKARDFLQSLRAK